MLGPIRIPVGRLAKAFLGKIQKGPHFAGTMRDAEERPRKCHPALVAIMEDHSGSRRREAFLIAKRPSNQPSGSSITISIVKLSSVAMEQSSPGELGSRDSECDLTDALQLLF